MIIVYKYNTLHCTMVFLRITLSNVHMNRRFVDTYPRQILQCEFDIGNTAACTVKFI